MADPAPKIQHGEKVALVLGAGGARGFAAIGAIEALEARGFRIVAIAGCSSGAVVGGIHAAGKLPAFRDWVSSLARGDVLRLLDFRFGGAGLFKGERVMAKVNELVGEHLIEELPIGFTAVATDLHAGREVWLTRGPLLDAIRASMAIPSLFTPQIIDGRTLVDGGLLDPVPIAATREYRSDLVVAVDMSTRAVVLPLLPSHAPAVPIAAEDIADESLLARVRERFAHLLGGNGAPAVPDAPGLVDLMSRSLDILQAQIARMQLALDPPHIHIRIPREAALFYEFWRARELIEVGREATLKAIDDAGY